MGTFEFDPDASVEENIEKFFVHVGTEDSELAGILQQEIQRLLPLPDGQRRATSRKAFNAAVAMRLEALGGDDSKE